jgi:hypothetical protein
MNWPVAPRTLAAGLLALGALAFVTRPEPGLVEAGPFAEPEQRAVERALELAAPEGFRIFAMDTYVVEAMVLSRKRYRFDAEAKLSPVDFLLGWGPLTLEPNLSGIRYTQDGRWGNYRFGRATIDVRPRDITLNAANTHMIPEPGNREVRRRLLRARRGDVLRMEGYLVRVEGPNGWIWESSRTRADFGPRACELFYVTHIE